MEARLSYEVGLLNRGVIRQFLDSQKFLHGGFDYNESKSWTGSVFAIKGDSQIVKAIERTLDEHIKETNII
jgi:hypothetical protein